MSPTLPLVLVVLTVAAAAAPALTRALGREAGWVVAGVLAAVLGALLPLAPAVLAGDAPTWSVGWIPGLGAEGVDLALRLDGLGLLFALLVLGVGALVLAYTARYLGATGAGARLYVLLTAFAAAMLLLVLADDVIVLYVGWELTSVVSFLLIGGDGVRGAKPAMRAFVVTAAGGLALLGGLVLAAVAAGTTSLTGILDSGAAIVAAPYGPAAAVLVLLGVATKSALLPFGFWLRGAMVAPTPVSTYLHAATMVKAGIYLLARLTPAFADVGLWTPVLVAAGLATTVLGGLQALRATDLKALLAGSTVSQLGFIAAVLGLGTEEAMVAGLLHTLAHAAFKGTLFMVAGVVDHETGSRDLRALSGLWRVMPGTAVVAALASLSMAGVPPLLGFVSKEEVLAAFEHQSPALLLVVGATAILTVAYSLRFFAGTFLGPAPDLEAHRPPRLFVTPPAVTALAGLALGLVVWLLDPLVAAAARDATVLAERHAPHLALWHGIEPPLLVSAAAIALGVLLWRAQAPVTRALARREGALDGAVRFDDVYEATLGLGRLSGVPFLGARLPQVLWIAGGVTLLAGVAAAHGFVAVAPQPWGGDAVEWGVAVLLAGTIVLTLANRSRLGAAALLGSVGFLMTVFFLRRGAPDLALTQLLVETLTVVLIVLVFRRLPEGMGRLPRARAAWTGLLALGAGAAAFLGTAALTGPRPRSEAATYYLTRAEEETGGTNVVNTILVDFRALDTLGEITVLLVAAVGIYVVVREHEHEEERPWTR